MASWWNGGSGSNQPASVVNKAGQRKSGKPLIIRESDLDDYFLKKLQPWLEKNVPVLMHRVLLAATKQISLPVDHHDLPHYDDDLSSINQLKACLHSKEQELQDCFAKQLKLAEEVEEMKSLQSVFDTGSYEEGAPSPPMLCESLDAVKNALFTCAFKLNSEVKKQMKAGQIKGENFTGGGHDTNVSLPRNSLFDFQLQLCHSLFEGFEILSFEDPILLISAQRRTFEKPRELKLRLFREFQHYKTIDEHTLFQLQQEFNFSGFLQSKMEKFVKGAGVAPFTDAAQREFYLNSMLDPHAGLHAGGECRPNNVFLDFAALGKAVWLLHKLAFSFQPTVEILWVASGSQYDADYMRNVQPDHEVEADAVKQYNGGTAAQVAFMVVPGFTLRNLIFKAEVYLKRTTSHHA